MAAARLSYLEYSRLDGIAADAGKLFPQAKAILIDGRAKGETDELIIAELDYQLKKILPLMLDQDVPLGTIRCRIHNGYATQSGESSGGFYSALVTDAPETLAGDAKTKTPPMFSRKNSAAALRLTPHVK